MPRSTVKGMDGTCLDCEVSLVCATGEIAIIYRCTKCGRTEAEIHRDALSREECIYRFVSVRCPQINNEHYRPDLRCERCVHG